KTIDQLYLVNIKSGEPVWTNEDMKGSGIAEYQYLPESDQILLVGDKKGLRDAVSASKQIMLIDASTENTVWQTPYKMRSPMVKRITMHNDSIYLYSFWGVAEVFNFKDGSRVMGTRDHTDTKNARKFKSFTYGDAGKSPELNVADPQFEDHYAYAVNPITYYGVGVPDWEAVKINMQKGEPVWRHNLTHYTQIKAIHLTTTNIVLRIQTQTT